MPNWSNIRNIITYNQTAQPASEALITGNIWDDGIKRGWIEPDKLYMLKWDFLHPVVPTDHLSIEDLGRLGAWGMREFYSKPGRIQRILESNFDELGKLCFKDVMSGIGKWEAGAVKGEKHI